MTPRPIRPLVTTKSLINLLGVVYVHVKAANGGDLYLTRFGLPYADLLDIDNWFEKRWFTQNRERLTGTSAVYKVQTRTVRNRSLSLVVKNCRVGEDVPMETHTLSAFLSTEFNSPWEEFSLTMEMRESTYGPRDVAIKTQQPLAIYVPPEQLQLWQTGRSRARINKITRRHPGITLDILKQYKLIYRWIEGLSIVEFLQEAGFPPSEIPALCAPLTDRSIEQMAAKGFAVADMKPSHIILSDSQVEILSRMGRDNAAQQAQLRQMSEWVHKGEYAVVDYELLVRTPKYEEKVKAARRHSYLDVMTHRYEPAPLPPFLSQTEIEGVPYVHGHAESTGGLLWVVGRNPLLFDYFLPERWRRTPCRQLSPHRDIFYTLSKDNVHLVWETSRVGEDAKSLENEEPHKMAAVTRHGFNSPFEEFALAHRLNESGIPTVYVRAIYMTGSAKMEPVRDHSRFDRLRSRSAVDNKPILRKNRNYITLRGYFNGPDDYVATHEKGLYRPFNLAEALSRNIIDREEINRLMEITRARLRNAGYTGEGLTPNDLLVTLGPDMKLVFDDERIPLVRLCNFEYIYTY